MALLVTVQIEKVYPSLRGSKGQCASLQGECATCSYTFVPEDGFEPCPRCNTDQSRCIHPAKEGSVTCGAHSPKFAIGLKRHMLNVSANAALSMSLMQLDGQDVEAEMTMAREAVFDVYKQWSEEKGKEKNEVRGELLQAIAIFAAVAERFKKITKGEDINIKLDDTTLGQIRERVHMIVQLFVDAMKEQGIPDKTIQTIIRTVLSANEAMSTGTVTRPAPRKIIDVPGS